MVIKYTEHVYATQANQQQRRRLPFSSKSSDC